jgi:HD superfamily phosphohydrolase
MALKKLSRPKFIRDPIHDIIRIEYEVVLDLLNSLPMQRLRRIKQLPFASFVYPGADHSRFAHSLGVYHLSSRMLDQLGIDDERDRVVTQIAALLHDIGHGPFSHLFEGFLKEVKYRPDVREDYCDHEWWTETIIQCDEGIKSLLDSVDGDLRTDVTSVLNRTHQKRILCDIVSSQFDADRLDYMLRDSQFTGVQYGRFDLSWLLRNLSKHCVSISDDDQMREEPERDVIVLDEARGLSCLEEYLLGNLYLYKHVYYHKTVQAAEGMLERILVRAIDLLRDNSELGVKSRALSRIAGNEVMATDEYLELDDNVVMTWLNGWASGQVDDLTLRSISCDLLNRRLFKTRDVTQVKGPAYARLLEALKCAAGERHVDSRYYMIEKDQMRIAYKNLFFFRDKKEPSQEIHLIDRNGQVHQYSAEFANRKIVSQAILGLSIESQLLVVCQPLVSSLDDFLKEE